MKYVLIIILFFSLLQLDAQKRFEIDGQFSVIGSYSPDNDFDVFGAIRYIPELNYFIPIDSVRKIDFEASVNIFGSLLFHPFDTLQHDGKISPYRGWVRYSGKRLQVRLGLQKIDFGQGMLLRPIQWFNQIDPRDPLQQTNGVYGGLVKYDFKNNANVWFWTLYGNDKRRGFDVFSTSFDSPEIGARFQFPVKRGEIGLSYNYRNASGKDLFMIPGYEHIPENRIGIDAKWDVVVGLWTEISHVHKSIDVGDFTNQTIVNLGTDYTFGIGNGLNVVAEHLLLTYDQKPLKYSNVTNMSATTLSYPLGFFDNLSAIFYYNWTSETATFLLNYSHQFKRLTGYVMAYYNPKTQVAVQQNEFVNTFSGPGLRVMVVYNH